ncbi:MAG: LamG-like jellyroll fold domain-containing protein [Planctomycetota bacterium]
MRLALSVLLGSLLVVACHDNHRTPGASTLTLVTGRVMDDRGQVVPDAVVTVVDTGVQVRTNADGLFAVEVAGGSHEIQASFGDVSLCAACFTVGDAEVLHLGDLYPGREPGCGQPTGCAGDFDCDGVSDVDELAGWDVTLVLGDDSVVVRHVDSDPEQVDTDGDGLNDADELAARTDPRRRDTDGDLLPDFAELFAYKSNPWVVDSDSDSRGPDGDAVTDPNLWDGYELLLTKTSPTMADTDGDGFTDWEEIHSGGTDPLVADLPRMALELYGAPTLTLNVTDVSTGSSTQIQSSLEKQSQGYQKTDTESTKMSIENTVQIHQELSVGTGNWPPSYEAKITHDLEFKHAYATESMASWTEESVQQSQSNYEEEIRNITSISYDDGMLWTALKIVNPSNVSYRIRDLRIAALRMRPGGSFEAIGTLALGELGPSGGWDAYEGAAAEFVLGPAAEYIGVVGADRLPAQVMRALVSNPTAMSFELGSYTMHKLDAFGNPTVNFAILGEAVIQRTGLIVIDYGNGQVERHLVATNVYRYPDGSGRGVSMREALQTIGLSYETAPHAVDAGRDVLTKVGAVESFIDEADPNVRGFWLVGGTDPVFDQPIVQPFEDLVLRGGGRVSLAFVKDSDGDGIFDNEEYLLGTAAHEPDSDGDSMDDFAESKVGWAVAVQGARPYAVFSDPRVADIDRDYLQDGAEFSLGTDPYRADTDGDRFEDGFDPSPLVPPCLDGRSLQLSAWWDGGVNGVTAIDLWAGLDPLDPPNPLDPVASDGQMFNAGAEGSIVESTLGDAVFVFNQDGDRVVVADPPTGATAFGLSPVHEFSVAMRVRWAGAPPTAPAGSWGTLMTKGMRETGTYAVSVRDTGELRFSVYRHVFEKRYGWLFGWVDNLAADRRRDEVTNVAVPTGVFSMPVNQWVDVVATFGRDSMSVYVDGALAHRVAVDYWYDESSTVRTHSVTEYLNGNSEPLWLGDNPAGGDPAFRRYSGYLDDVKYFHRALSADEVQRLHALGNCIPSGQ